MNRMLEEDMMIKELITTRIREFLEKFPQEILVI